MPRAVWKGAVIAESDEVRVVDGYTYFPPDKVRREHLQPSDHHTACHWKGVASYCHVVVGDDVNHNAAWYYPETSPEARIIQNWIGFWRGVKIEP